MGRGTVGDMAGDLEPMAPPSDAQVSDQAQAAAVAAEVTERSEEGAVADVATKGEEQSAGEGVVVAGEGEERASSAEATGGDAALAASEGSEEKIAEGETAAGEAAGASAQPSEQVEESGEQQQEEGLREKADDEQKKTKEDSAEVGSSTALSGAEPIAAEGTPLPVKTEKQTDVTCDAEVELVATTVSGQPEAEDTKESGSKQCGNTNEEDISDNIAGLERELAATNGAGVHSEAPVDESSVSGKRKEREADQNSEALNGENHAKKQKTESSEDSSVSALETDPAAPIAATPIMISRDDMAKMEEDDGTLKFDVITNDGDPEHMVQLTTLKNIFAKQLPKMPKEYIVRLVFDRNHRSMIILKNGKHVIGGICYRPFEPNHFAEIAFCAINASDQVKGYGTRLMNHLKEYVKLKGISYFLTYADNYAIGYFKKQGFSKVVSMPRPNWFGYIKDYDGGTLMECTIHHQINYLRITSMVQKQRQAILDKIKQNSRAHIVYPGLANFAEGRLLDIYMIPGVKEAGWSQATIRNNRIGTRDPGSLKTQLTQLLKAVSSHRSAWPFHEPVDTSVVVDYLDYIKEPIDLQLIGKRVESGTYVSKAQFKTDLEKMCTNCTIYNSPDTNYYKAAVDLQEFISKRVQVRDQPR